MSPLIGYDEFESGTLRKADESYCQTVVGFVDSRPF